MHSTQAFPKHSALDFSVSAWDVRKKTKRSRNVTLVTFGFLSLLNAESRIKMQLSGGHVIAARGLVGLSQKELADLVGVAPKTILRFEQGHRLPSAETIKKIQDELERRGIEFTNGTGTGVRLNHAKAAEFARTVGQARPEADRQGG